MINVYFYLDEEFEEGILDVQTHSFPHKVGDIVHLSLHTYTEHWTVEPFSGDFEITRIIYDYQKRYPPSGNVQHIKDIITYEVTVKKIEE